MKSATQTKQYKAVAGFLATDSEGRDVFVSSGTAMIPSGASDKGRFFMVNGVELHVNRFDFSKINKG